MDLTLTPEKEIALLREVLQERTADLELKKRENMELRSQLFQLETVLKAFKQAEHALHNAVRTYGDDLMKESVF